MTRSTTRRSTPEAEARPFGGILSPARRALRDNPIARPRPRRSAWKYPEGRRPPCRRDGGWPVWREAFRLFFKSLTSTWRLSRELTFRPTRPSFPHLVMSATTPWCLACNRSASSPGVAHSRPGNPLMLSNNRYCNGVTPCRRVISSLKRRNRRSW